MKISRSNDFTNIKENYYRNILIPTVKALQKRDFTASYYSNAEIANRSFLKKIPKSASIGIGGSVTIRELGIMEKFQKRGNKVFHHWKKGLTESSDQEIRKKEGQADYYLTSANAITMDGDIINIDGIGNRVSDMVYGPKHVLIIAGYNKIVSSIDEGMRRAKEIAAVMNAKRVNAQTPCATTGKCVDCTARGRICRVVSIIMYRPWQTDIHVMLVNQPLGF